LKASQSCVKITFIVESNTTETKAHTEAILLVASFAPILVAAHPMSGPITASQ
jgi:hypothetical protein